MPSIFICTSFSSKVDSNGLVLSEHRKATEGILSTLRSAGFNCFCALEDEDWKITEKNPAEEFMHDLDMLTKSDIMVVILDTELSAGVQIEIGYMLNELTRNPDKQMILAHPVGSTLAWSNAAISALPGVKEVIYSQPEDIITVLR